MVDGKPMSASKLASENAYRKKKGMPPLVPDAVPGAAPAQAGASQAEKAAAPAAAARPAAVAAPVAAVPVDRTGAATRYVGTPAVGTSKAASAGGVAVVGPMATPADHRRRRFVWAMVAAFLGTWLLSFFRFFLPRALFEPSTTFKIGSPSDFGLGVDTKFQQLYRIWVDKTPDRLFVIYARCTHLGCTPDWKPAENKFKCPCHGSGYDSEGINFEGPAPRPMDRAHVSVAPDGQILVDVGKLYMWPKGLPNQFNTYDEGTNSGAYIRV
jgi:cytochrome b6-f complex iron-sulfur subunit